MSYLLEVCADSVRSAIAAQEGGADRVELCSGLVIGGLSPSPAMFRKVKRNTDLKIRVLLRPRFGDFCYDEYEFQTLKEEVEQFRDLGADGVVVGPGDVLNVAPNAGVAMPEDANGAAQAVTPDGQEIIDAVEALEEGEAAEPEN